jgi:hypothetical protein
MQVSPTWYYLSRPFHSIRVAMTALTSPPCSFSPVYKLYSIGTSFLNNDGARLGPQPDSITSILQLREKKASMSRRASVKTTGAPESSSPHSGSGKHTMLDNLLHDLELEDKTGHAISPTPVVNGTSMKKVRRLSTEVLSRSAFTDKTGGVLPGSDSPLSRTQSMSHMSDSGHETVKDRFMYPPKRRTTLREGYKLTRIPTPVRLPCSTCSDDILGVTVIKSSSMSTIVIGKLTSPSLSLTMPCDGGGDEYTNLCLSFTSASCSFYSYTPHCPSFISFLHYLTISLS